MERRHQKSELAWKAGHRDNQKVLQWWETWLREQPREGRLPAATALSATGKWSHSLVDTYSLDPVSHRPGACAGWGLRATGGTQLQQRHSAKQSVVSPAPALPLFISLCSSPGRLAGHSQPWPQQRRAACPLLQRAHQPQERGEPGAASCGRAPACRSHPAPVGRSPAFCSKKTCAGASSGCSCHPSTSGVLIIHSYTWHFNPLKAIPSNNNNTATSCVRTHSLYRIPCLQKPSLLLCYPKHLLPLT